MNILNARNSCEKFAPDNSPAGFRSSANRWNFAEPIKKKIISEAHFQFIRKLRRKKIKRKESK